MLTSCFDAKEPTSRDEQVMKAATRLAAIALSPPGLWNVMLRDEGLSEVRWHILRTRMVNLRAWHLLKNDGEEPDSSLGAICDGARYLESAARLMVSWRKIRR